MPRSAAYPAALILAWFALTASALAERVMLSWDDLMPEGEYERLEEMYAAYMAGLEQQLASSQATSLMDAGPGGFIAEGSPLDQMVQLGTYNTVADLDGLDVRIPGYITPFDFNADGMYTEFLLVPYFGACIHVPPPPPNQIVYVKTEAPVEIKDIWSPIFAEGRMATQRHLNDTGNAAYTLTLSKIEPYDFP